ncbi:MAG: transcriptional regulator, TetR family [Caulobacteraceae bacterium]|nr:transcriptional regulator, TetR family [Caulobacteraceae bacterium]
MRKGDATRIRILDEAALQAAARGLGGVSLNDLALAVGLSKSGIFKHFESKEVMQHAVMEREMQRFAESVWGPVEPLPPGRERLSRIFDLWVDRTERESAAGGCLIMAANAEFDDQPGPLRDMLQAGLRRWSKTITREFQVLGDPPLSEAEAALCAFQMKSFVLGHNESRRLLEEKGARRMARQAFDGLLDRAAKG